MNYYKKQIAVKNNENISLPQIYNNRSFSLNKEIPNFVKINSQKYKLYFSSINSNQSYSDRYQQKPQHMRNIQRKHQMLKLQLQRVSPYRLQYETLEEIYFIRHKKLI